MTRNFCFMLTLASYISIWPCLFLFPTLGERDDPMVILPGLLGVIAAYALTAAVPLLARTRDRVTQFGTGFFVFTYFGYVFYVPYALVMELVQPTAVPPSE